MNEHDAEYRCSYCERKFRTQQGRDQHENRYCSWRGWTRLHVLRSPLLPERDGGSQR